jgi:hypothetical protein
LHNVGEEWYSKTAFRADRIVRDATFDVLLYEDTIDTLTDADDIGAITTEASGGNYARQSVSFDSTDITLSQSADGTVESQFTVTFDVRNTGGSTDAWAAVVAFQSDVVNAESAENPHLLASSSLNQGRVSLSANDELEVIGTFGQE